ncbi:MAG TPA: glycine cleavage system aminomethyltransferase GcvT [Longimicrobiales bacterium]|nr:glycine cleavage system aminomethyltransferase GcvT [Longimicrobiales bacterium]
MADELKRTPLFEEHHRLGAKIIPFAGYEMPVHYPAGIVAEHNAVRQKAGLFDVSHMGELEVRGGDALGFIQYVTTNDASKLEVGQAQYSVLCQEDGTALDDCIVYRFDDHYMVVVNASNVDQDRDWISKFAGRFGTDVVDRSDQTALLALQGPAAARILQPLTDVDLDALKYYHFQRGQVDGMPAIVSRTGYTGEDGFELYIGAGDAVQLWKRLLEAGSGEGILPIGLGARDTLRLEVGYILYGNDLDDRHTPFEAGLGWVTKLDKGDFIGRSALEQRKAAGLTEKLAGFVLRERGFPRPGYDIRWNGELSGQVTSGVLSPTLNQGIGLAYLPTEAAKPGTTIEIMIRDKAIPAEVVRPPFYKDGSIHR